eukprot:CAMPEP_0181340348 /NCGR_PEP_ID=MMETSP1101-20121128/29789_1 /TAXON_ID=46948 /ORGANISM="Rhodomonas abbreviata, Strain Caron Lab Isolate" /LENGTH=79 /DNA_ID=CAMNT_0023451473 /DNA_START=1 /DNA_END=237 /DNA_ORIENTATION=-
MHVTGCMRRDELRAHATAATAGTDCGLWDAAWLPGCLAASPHGEGARRRGARTTLALRLATQRPPHRVDLLVNPDALLS